MGVGSEHLQFSSEGQREEPREGNSSSSTPSIFPLQNFALPSLELLSTSVLTDPLRNTAGDMGRHKAQRLLMVSQGPLQTHLPQLLNLLPAASAGKVGGNPARPSTSPVEWSGPTCPQWGRYHGATAGGKAPAGSGRLGPLATPHQLRDCREGSQREKAPHRVRLGGGGGGLLTSARMAKDLLAPSRSSSLPLIPGRGSQSEAPFCNLLVRTA